jgi:hypothetical protein
MRIAGGAFAAAGGAACLWYGGHGWAAFFLSIGAPNLSGGSWYLTITRSQEPGAKHLGRR